MLVNEAARRARLAADDAGIERSVLRINDSDGRSSLVRLTAGSRSPRHAHHRTAQVAVLSGCEPIAGVEFSRSPYA